MKILIALTYYRPHYSGLTIYAEREARALVQRGHQVTILTSRFDKRLPSNEIRDGVQIVRLDVLFRISKGVIMPGILPAAWKLVQEADIVHLHVPQLDAALIALISRLMKKPVLLTYHCDLQLPSGLIHSMANLGSNLANRLTATIADLIVTNTQDYANHSNFLQTYLHKLRPVFPPVEVHPITDQNLEEFITKYQIEPEQRIIGMAARLAAEKGVEYLAEALPIILEKHPTARVLFVGPYQNVLGEEQYSIKLYPLIEALGDHWTFLGIISPEEMSAFFHLSEVTVLPSINSTESYGLVQVESLLCKTPVIASDLPGIRVPVQTTGSGLIVPPGHANELARAIIELLNAPQDYQGDPSQITEKSTPQAVGQIYEDLFLEILKSTS
ncbi:MAG TPA: glycosyltransferase family 4 protein [Anaerolineales bacterium]|nr:glycosyltransferase family 4 protein [Anaerolineales bacterium]